MFRQKSPFCIKGHEYAVVGKTTQNGCKECDRIHSKEYRQAHPLERRNWQYKIKFGISLEDYNILFNNQKGLCLGCYRHQSLEKRAFAVDHNHTTGKIRGLLCGNCNVTLGNAKDNPQILRRLADYLEAHQETKNDE